MNRKPKTANWRKTRQGFFLPLAIFFVLLVILVIAPLWFYIIQFKINKSQPSPTPQTSTPSASPDDTANWKTYIYNHPTDALSAFHFSIRYPQSYYLTNITEMNSTTGGLPAVVISDKKVTILGGRHFGLNSCVEIYVTYAGDQVSDIYEMFSGGTFNSENKSKVLKTENITLGGLSGTKREVIRGGETEKTLEALVVKNTDKKAAYYLRDCSERDNELFSKILPTFKFTQ